MRIASFQLCPLYDDERKAEHDRACQEVGWLVVQKTRENSAFANARRHMRRPHEPCHHHLVDNRGFLAGLFHRSWCRPFFSFLIFFDNLFYHDALDLESTLSERWVRYHRWRPQVLVPLVARGP